MIENTTPLFYLSPTMSIVASPDLFMQYFKGLIIGFFIGWGITSYLYYKQYNTLISCLEGDEE